MPGVACGLAVHAQLSRSIQKLKLLNWQHGQLFTTGGQYIVRNTKALEDDPHERGTPSEILSLLSLGLLLGNFIIIIIIAIIRIIIIKCVKYRAFLIE